MFPLFLSFFFSYVLAQTPNGSEYQEVEDLNHFSAYNSNYFLYGHNSSKLQFSFKYAVIKKWDIFMGYSQVMFWDLEGESKPFKDVTYDPEFFHRASLNSGYLESIDLSPLEHVSNGKDGPESRSFNRAYARFNFVKRDVKRTFRLTSKIAFLYAVDKENKDIGHYVGPLTLTFSVTEFAPWIFDQGEAYVSVSPGGDWNRGNREIGISFRAKLFGFNPSLYMQLHDGFAESLVRYSQRETRFRVGLKL